MENSANAAAAAAKRNRMELLVGNVLVVVFICKILSCVGPHTAVSRTCGKHNVIVIKKFRSRPHRGGKLQKPVLTAGFGRVPALVTPLRELTMARTRYWKQTRFERIYRKGTAGGTRGPR